jgi:RND family efflux transporter MFP subunit
MTRFNVRALSALAASGALLAALVGLSGCKSEATEAQQAPAPQVSVASALERDVTEWDEFTGRLEAVESVEVRPRVTGYIESVNFSEGQHGAKRRPAVRHRPASISRRAVEGRGGAGARSRTFRAGRSDEARSAKLLDIKAVSREEYDTRINASREAKADVAAARAAVDSAKLNLEFTRITAPISGRVSKAAVTAGNLVTGGSNTAALLTTVVSLDPMYVTFEGDEQIYLKYNELSRRGERSSSRDAANPVLMGLANENGYPHHGAMVFVDNQVDTRTGTIRARASFENKDGYLTPGLFAARQAARPQLVPGRARR